MSQGCGSAHAQGILDWGGDKVGSCQVSTLNKVGKALTGCYKVNGEWRAEGETEDMVGEEEKEGVTEKLSEIKKSENSC